mmetsp:Transcript_11756/g.30519  ORF Transcript_11756/g.30519 Transcript_11756/m.30519 type:complete len:240 (-) Transcript_11756:115-834(-)
MLVLPPHDAPLRLREVLRLDAAVLPPCFFPLGEGLKVEKLPELLLETLALHEYVAARLCLLDELLIRLFLLLGLPLPPRLPLLGGIQLLHGDLAYVGFRGLEDNVLATRRKRKRALRRRPLLERRGHHDVQQALGAPPERVREHLGQGAVAVGHVGRVCGKGRHDVMEGAQGLVDPDRLLQVLALCSRHGDVLAAREVYEVHLPDLAGAVLPVHAADREPDQQMAPAAVLVQVGGRHGA